MVAMNRRALCGSLAFLGGCAHRAPRLDAVSAFSSEVEHLRFESGMQAVLCKTPPTTHGPPRVFIGLYVRYGIASEQRPELAHLVEHVVANNAPTLQDFDIPVDFRPRFSNAMTRLDYTSLWRVVPPEMLDAFVGNRANRALGVNNDPAIFERERERVVAEIERQAAGVEAAYGRDPDRLLAEAFRGASANVAERAAMTRAATSNETFDAIAAFYRPANCVLIVAGDFEMPTARASVMRRLQAYRALPGSQPRPAPAFVPYSGPLSARSTVLTRPFVAAGLQAPDRHSDAFTAFLVLDQLLLGGRQGFAAPAEIVRAQDAPLPRYLASMIGACAFDDSTHYSQHPPSLAFASPSYHTIRFAVPRGVTGAQAQSALETALAELAGAVSDEDIVAARDQLEAFLSGWMLSPSLLALADHLAAFAMIDGDGRRLNRLPSEIRAVRPQDVRSLMLRHERDLKPRLAMLEPVD